MSQKTTEQSSSPQSLGKKRSFTRRLLLILGPLTVVLVTTYVYLTGGRFITTDNAYIKADKVAISAEVSGSIVEVMVAENDFVKKGTPLFKIDDRSYLIALEQAKARLQEAAVEIETRKVSYRQKENELGLAQSNINFARKEYARQSALDSSQAVAKAQLDSARHELEVNQFKRSIIKSQMNQILAGLEGSPDIAPDQLASYRLAQAMVEKASLDLKRTTILAPFSGRVSKIPQTGKHLEPGTPVMSLIADGGFWVEANIKETELTRVEPGQKVRLVVDTYPDEQFRGTVLSISPGTGSEYSILPAQNATGNWVKVVQRIPVRISVDDTAKEHGLRSGMSTMVKIDTGYHRPLPHIVQKVLTALGINREAVAAVPGDQ